MWIQPIAGIEESMAPTPKLEGLPTKSFQGMLKRGIQYVDQLQSRADHLMQAYASGETQNIHEVMIAVTEANIALQLTMSIRNQALQAYQEIMRMQV